MGEVGNGTAEENCCRSDWPLYAGSANHFPVLQVSDWVEK